MELWREREKLYQISKFKSSFEYSQFQKPPVFSWKISHFWCVWYCFDQTTETNQKGTGRADQAAKSETWLVNTLSPLFKLVNCWFRRFRAWSKPLFIPPSSYYYFFKLIVLKMNVFWRLSIEYLVINWIFLHRRFYEQRGNEKDSC